MNFPDARTALRCFGRSYQSPGAGSGEAGILRLVLDMPSISDQQSRFVLSLKLASISHNAGETTAAFIAVPVGVATNVEVAADVDERTAIPIIIQSKRCG